VNANERPLDNIFIGLGAIDPIKKTTIPVAVFKAQPGKDNTIRPHVTYYVGTGEYKPGTIIDVSTISKALEVDFTGKPQLDAVVTHDEHGKLSVTFV
jgi:hypothetical protein